MKALIFENKVVQIEEKEFPVAKPMAWLDAPEGLEVGDIFDGETFTKPVLPQPSEEEMAQRDLRDLDIQMGRITEDLIDILKLKGVIDESDVPAPAMEKLNQRKIERARLKK